MKYLLVVSFLLITSCKQNKNIDENIDKKDNDIFAEKYQKAIGKHIKSFEVQNLLKDLGSDYEYTDHEIIKFFTYDNLGFQLNFTEKDTLHVILLELDKLDSKIVLPHGITAFSTREEIEKKLGKADDYNQSTILNVEYLEENILVKYKSPDLDNLNNKITHLGLLK